MRKKKLNTKSSLRKQVKKTNFVVNIKSGTLDSEKNRILIAFYKGEEDIEDFKMIMDKQLLIK